MTEITVRLTDEEHAVYQAEADRRYVPVEIVAAMALAKVAYEDLGLADYLQEQRHVST